MREQTALLRSEHVEAKSSHVKAFDKCEEYCDGVNKWLEDKETEQEGMALTEDAVVM